MLYVTSTTRQEHYNCAARWQLSVGCEFTRGKPSVVRKANDNLALLQQVRQAGPSAGERTTEPQIWHSCQETTTLVQTHRQLAESGGKSPEDKQQGLRTLSSEVRQELACMRRAERICRHRKRKECSIPQWFGGKSIGRSKKKPWCGVAWSYQRMWISSSQTHQVCGGGLPHSKHNQCPDIQLFLGCPDELKPPGIHNRIAAAGSGNCHGVFHLPHSLFHKPLKSSLTKGK